MARTTLLFKDVRRWALVAACAPLVMLAGCPQNQDAAKAKVPAQATAPAITNRPAGKAQQAAKVAAAAKPEPVDPEKAYKDQQLINHAEQLYRSGVDNYSAGHLDAARADFDSASAVKQGSRIRVATKYVSIARDHFADKGVHVDLIKLYGSMELAPLTGLADAIVDLVSTGNTLKANKLVEVEPIMDISSRLVVNQAALKLKREPIRALIEAFASATPKS